ncbi:hypothetical protein Tco_1496044, partial [Tanacetum coccineum]
TIPPSPDYTPVSLDYSPASDTEFDPSEDPSSDHIPPLPATSPFLSSTNDSSDSDIPDTPPSHSSSSASPSRKRSRSPVASIPLSSSVPGALSSARADLLPSPKRIRKAGLGVDVEDESSEPSGSRGTDLEVDVNVERTRGIDARVVVEAVDREEIKASTRGPIEVRVDKVTHPVIANNIPEPAQEGVVEVTYETLKDLVQRTMLNTQSGASRTREGVNEQIDRRMAGALGARDAARNLKPLMGDGGGQEEVNGNRGNRNGGNGNGGNGNGGNGNGGNGNGNGNGGGNGYNFGGFVPARECTYQDFLKCQPLSFNGMEGVVGLNRWVQKMETVFHISNCPEKYQV